MDFDPDQISFEELLRAFWRAHNPFTPPCSRQYRSVILYGTAEQERIAKASKAALEASRGQVYADIEPLKAFYLAEDYHQKFYLRRGNQIMAEVMKRFPSLDQLIDSHDVALLNGYVGGYGTLARLEQDLPHFGLSPAAERRLRQIVEGFGR